MELSGKVREHLNILQTYIDNVASRTDNTSTTRVVSTTDNSGAPNSYDDDETTIVSGVPNTTTTNEYWNRVIETTTLNQQQQLPTTQSNDRVHPQTMRTGSGLPIVYQQSPSLFANLKSSDFSAISSALGTLTTSLTAGWASLPGSKQHRVAGGVTTPQPRYSRSCVNHQSRSDDVNRQHQHALLNLFSNTPQMNETFASVLMTSMSVEDLPPVSGENITTPAVLVGGGSTARPDQTSDSPVRDVRLSAANYTQSVVTCGGIFTWLLEVTIFSLFGCFRKQRKSSAELTTTTATTADIESQQPASTVINYELRVAPNKHTGNPLHQVYATSGRYLYLKNYKSTHKDKCAICDRWFGYMRMKLQCPVCFHYFCSSCYGSDLTSRMFWDAGCSRCSMVVKRYELFHGDYVSRLENGVYCDISVFVSNTTDTTVATSATTTATTSTDEEDNSNTVVATTPIAYSTEQDEVESNMKLSLQCDLLRQSTLLRASSRVAKNPMVKGLQTFLVPETLHMVSSTDGSTLANDYSTAATISVAPPSSSLTPGGPLRGYRPIGRSGIAYDSVNIVTPPDSPTGGTRSNWTCGIYSGSKYARLMPIGRFSRADEEDAFKVLSDTPLVLPFETSVTAREGGRIVHLGIAFLSFAVDTSEVTFRLVRPATVNSRDDGGASRLFNRGALVIGKFSNIVFDHEGSSILLYGDVGLSAQVPLWVLRFVLPEDAEDWFRMLKLAWELLAPAQQILLASRHISGPPHSPTHNAGRGSTQLLVEQSRGTDETFQIESGLMSVGPESSHSGGGEFDQISSASSFEIEIKN